MRLGGVLKEIDAGFGTEIALLCPTAGTIIIGI